MPHVLQFSDALATKYRVWVLCLLSRSDSWELPQYVRQNLAEITCLKLSATKGAIKGRVEAEFHKFALVMTQECPYIMILRWAILFTAVWICLPWHQITYMYSYFYVHPRNRSRKHRNQVWQPKEQWEIKGAKSFDTEIYRNVATALMNSEFVKCVFVFVQRKGWRVRPSTSGNKAARETCRWMHGGTDVKRDLQRIVVVKITWHKFGGIRTFRTAFVMWFLVWESLLSI